MNSTFSLRRTALYARKHYTENARYYLYGLLAASLILFLVSLFDSREPGIIRVAAAYLMMAFYYYFVRLSCRSHYERKSMTTVYTLPVTAAEKYLFIWFNTTVVATAVFGLLLWLVTATEGIPGSNIIYPTWLAILTVQSGLLLACCWGREYPMKQFLLLACAFILFFVLYYRGMTLTGGLFAHIPFSEIHVNARSGSAILAFPLREQLSRYGAWTMVFGYWILVSWVTGYFKFRERTLK